MTVDTKSGKKEKVRKMFNEISYRYDFLNHFLSMGIDILWRKKLVDLLKKQHPKYVLDVATGTGDLAITASRIEAIKIIGVDIAEEMLAVGRKKINQKKLDHKIELRLGDSENLPFETGTFDAAIVAFGVRNFENLDKGLTEMYRVLSVKSKVYILEFSMPEKFPIRQLYHFYFKNILPLIGRVISKDRVAYTYLHDSVQEFPSGEAFLNRLNKAGFENASQLKLSFGIASIYVGEKA
ncbi:MAG: bifunctional demethylmenaquinone methyltransferase/2-methoxy-6-polyprenyl-1,4-benzoquinol methylase UbiE [Bacteroidetes bacterium HGW-Bacteroidetes-17]|nr:MAG: bifunctional demethylmenaquinone methyltransferase/2-methoxy-6-polyprenyl-1,4-benzoquinol methylase UbiE [Bacteroidetes bacterium HGW-Bacteroidetes-17]